MLEKNSAIQFNNNANNKSYHGIKIQEIPFLKKINIRINSNNKENLAKCANIIGILLPTKPNVFFEKEKIKVLWLGPNEWLVVNENQKDLFEKLHKNIGDIDSSITDISDTRTIIRISGDKSYTLLSKFLVLDLEKNLSNKFSCAQTIFVKVPIIILKNNNKSNVEIDILTNRSHANYIYNLLIDGAKNLYI